MDKQNPTQLAERVIDEVARWPEVSLVSPVQARTILDGITLANHADLGGNGVARRNLQKPHVGVLKQAMCLPTWRPEDHAPILIARVCGTTRMENGHHRLAAVAGMDAPVGMLVRCKEYGSMGDYRESLASHDTAVALRGIGARMSAVGCPVPKLGITCAALSVNAMVWPKMAAGAWAVYQKLGNPRWTSRGHWRRGVGASLRSSETRCRRCRKRQM